MEGEFAAVAYSSSLFYIGQIMERMVEEDGPEEDEEDDFADEMFVEKPDQNIKLKFLSWNKHSQTLYWPLYNDIDVVYGRFVYRNDIKLYRSKKKDTFNPVPDFAQLKQEYLAYQEKYDLA